MTPAALSSEMSKAPFERVTCSPYWSQKEKLEGCVNLAAGGVLDIHYLAPGLSTFHLKKILVTSKASSPPPEHAQRNLGASGTWLAGIHASLDHFSDLAFRRGSGKAFGLY